MKDIENRQDIELLVQEFYKKVLQDEQLSPFFRHLNFELHLPKMVDFWSFVLLNESGYTTDVTKMHIRMPIKKEHFDRWLELFNVTLDTHYSGEKTELARQRAFLIRWTIESKINKDE